MSKDIIERIDGYYNAITAKFIRAVRTPPLHIHNFVDVDGKMQSISLGDLQDAKAEIISLRQQVKELQANIDGSKATGGQ